MDLLTIFMLAGMTLFAVGGIIREEWERAIDLISLKEECWIAKGYLINEEGMFMSCPVCGEDSIMIPSDNGEASFLSEPHCQKCRCVFVPWVNYFDGFYILRRRSYAHWKLNEMVNPMKRTPFQQQMIAFIRANST